MRFTSAERTVRELLKQAGVTVNGKQPWDISVHDPRFYRRVLAQGSLGLGESYMDGWWDCKKLDLFFEKIILARIEEHLPHSLSFALHVLRSRVLNLQTKRRAMKVAKEHYDLGNDFYMAFLDPYNQYTCGYFRDTEDLNRAQEQKLDLICRKLQLKKGDHVLDIGCGWGGFAKYAAKHYGCRVTGITISQEQASFAREFCKGLPVEIRLTDYRDLKGSFDKVLICGMIEHVGYKNYRTILRKVWQCLKEDGLFLLHTIGTTVSVTTSTDPWTTRYIFPNSMLPSASQIGRAIEGLFVMEDWHNFGAYYAPTLRAWYRNFVKSWPAFRKRYGERFFRMFAYYLLSFAGAFEVRSPQLWQVVLSKNGVPGGYSTVR
ncbi:cyclopropane fatty acyl phospholipid synthase [Candidatus Peregrinibacteria bacterium]|nr:cyclopropane fatty acyl phospholipid synthase [Candidatus Peregrinibacteria bacterium]